MSRPEPFHENLSVKVLDSLPFNIAILDSDGTIVATNDRWNEWGQKQGMDWDPDRFAAGSNYLTACQELDWDSARRISEELRKLLNGTVEEVEMEYPCHASGQDQWFILRALPFRYQERRYVLVAHIDITERKRSEIRSSRLGKVVENIQVGLIIYRCPDLSDPSGYRFDYLNPAAEGLLEVDKEDLLGVPIEEYFTEFKRSKLSSLFRTVLQFGQTETLENYEYEGSRLEGRYWNLKVFPLESDTLGVAFEEVTRQVQNRRRLEYMALHDDLTGLLDRRRFMEKLGEEVERARRYGNALTALLLDLDHFKRINDRYGHLAGDEVLAEVGELLRESTRESDVASRYGGEEFAILLPQTELEEGEQFAHRLLEKVGTLKHSPSDVDDSFQVTCSIGVASLRESDRQIVDLINRADRAMYRAKELGRNRVVTERHKQVDTE